MKTATYFLIILSCLCCTATAQAQVYDSVAALKDSLHTRSKEVRPTHRNVDESLNRAAEAASRAADKLKVVIEQKAEKISKTSQPLIENFLIATSDLIEKIADEISTSVDEKPAKRSK